jgi:hypothetical protein
MYVLLLDGFGVMSGLVAGAKGPLLACMKVHWERVVDLIERDKIMMFSDYLVIQRFINDLLGSANRGVLSFHSPWKWALAWACPTCPT